MLPLRPNVCMLVYNQGRHLWLGERYGEPGVWQFPQGGVDPGTTALQSVVRELEEELGISAADLGKIIPLSATHEYYFEAPRDYGGTIYAGQRQTFWAVEFRGLDSSIRLDAHDQEFSAWRWCLSQEVLSLADPKRGPGYVRPINEFNALSS